MFSSLEMDVDFIDELRMRRWARENFVPVDDRNGNWHPIVLEEMRRKDVEANSEEPSPAYAFVN